MNICDLTSLALTQTILIGRHLTPFSMEISTLRLVASVASCLLVIKIYDWLRLFDKPSFFVRLISQTLYDIRSFIILFFIALLMFSVPIDMLNLNRTEEAEALTVTFFGQWLIDGLMNEYLLSLGEFGSMTTNASKGTSYE